MIFRTASFWSGVFKEYQFGSSITFNGAYEIIGWLSDELHVPSNVDDTIETLHELHNNPPPNFSGYIGTGNAHNMGMIKGIVYLEQYDTFVNSGASATEVANALGLPASSYANGAVRGFQAYSVVLSERCPYRFHFQML